MASVVGGRGSRRSSPSGARQVSAQNNHSNQGGRRHIVSTTVYNVCKCVLQQNKVVSTPTAAIDLYCMTMRSEADSAHRLPTVLGLRSQGARGLLN